MYRKALIFLALLLPVPAQADLAGETDMTATAAKAMALLDKQDYEGAIEVIRPHMPLPKHELDGLVYQIQQQAPTINDRFGKAVGSELVCRESIGGAFVRLTYLQKYERHALLWTFDFYRPRTAWVLNGFSFHDRWQELFGTRCATQAGK